MIDTIKRRLRIKAQIRSKISGTAEQPRLTVFRSNSNIYAQIINDVTGKTLVSASSLVAKPAAEKGAKKAAKSAESTEAQISKQQQAEQVGAAIAKKALEAGISQVVFDRNGYLYHGRVKNLADAARNAGLKF